MTQELSPTQMATTIPDDVWDRVESAAMQTMFDNPNTTVKGLFLATLPILTEAIERRLIERMIADLKGTVVIYGQEHVALDSIEPWLRTFLSAATESEATEGTTDDDSCPECSGEGGFPFDAYGEKGVDPCGACNGTGKRDRP